MKKEIIICIEDLTTPRQIYESVASDFAEGSWTGIGNMVYKLRRKIGTKAIRTVRNCDYSLVTNQPSKR